MSHKHHHSHTLEGKKLFIAIILNLLIALSQILGGFFSGSLALVSDGMHNISDVAALLIAWWANSLAKKESSSDKTFGYKRAEILATLFNAMLLTGIGVYLIVESFHRFDNPEPITANIVVYMALLGILLNTLSVFLLKKDANKNINIKAAYLHLLTDVMTSVAVLLGAFAMMFYKIYWLDALLSILIALYLIKSSFALLYESGAILMQFAPKNLDTLTIKKHLLEHKALKNVMHVHLWQLSDTENIFEAELEFKENLTLKDLQEVIREVKKSLKDKFNLEHTTLAVSYRPESL